MPEAVVNGIKTYYEIFGDYSPDRITLMLIHGACQSSLMWEYQYGSLTRYTRFNSIAIDLPGHGRSGGRALDSIRQYSEFIHGFVSVMGLEKLVLAGHSMGGRISQLYVIDHRSHVEAAILAGTGPRIRVSRAILEMIENDYEHFCEIAARNSFSVNADPAKTELFKKRLLESGKDTCLTDMLACNEFDTRERLDSIDIPVLIIAGADDILAPVSCSKELYRNIDDSRLIVIQDAGHFMMIERSIEFNRQVLKFLDFL